MITSTKSLMGKAPILGLFVIAVLFSSMIPSAAFAETVSVSINGDSHDITYTGTNVSITSTDVDNDFTSLIFGVDVTNDGVLEIVLPRNAIDAKFQDIDEEFIIIADGTEPQFSEISTSPTSRTLRIDLDIGTTEIEIIGSVFGSDNTPDSTEPAPPSPPVVVACTDDGPPVCGVDGTTYDNMCKLGDAGVAFDHDGACVDTNSTPTTTCGVGTILRDGVCVPACGPGLVLQDNVCIIDDGSSTSTPSTTTTTTTSATGCGPQTILRDGVCVPACGPGLVLENNTCVLDDTTPATVPTTNNGDTVAPTSTHTKGSNVGLIYGVVGGFVVAFAVILVLGIMARLSRSSN